MKRKRLVETSRIAAAARVAFALVLVLSCLCCGAQPQTSDTLETSATEGEQQPGFRGNATAIAMLHDIERVFDESRWLFVDVVCTQSLTDDSGEQSSCTRNAKIWLRHPDKFVWISTGGGEPWTVMTDGKTVITYLPERRFFTMRGFSPSALDAELLVYCGNYGMILTHVFCTTLRGNVPVTLTRGADLGLEDFAEGKLHHVQFGNEQMVADVWYNERELPVRIEENVQNKEITSILVVSIEWKNTQPIPEHSFTIVPPEDAQKVDKLPPLDNCERRDEETSRSAFDGI